MTEPPTRQQLKTNLKAVGLSEELKEYVAMDAELECVLRLNNQVQVVRDKHTNNKLKNKHLEKQFELLEEQFNRIIKESGKKESTRFEKKA